MSKVSVLLLQMFLLFVIEELSVVEPLLPCCSHAFQTEVIPLISLLLLGKTEFGPDEDAHVVGDCIKVVVVTT